MFCGSTYAEGEQAATLLVLYNRETTPMTQALMMYVCIPMSVGVLVRRRILLLYHAIIRKVSCAILYCTPISLLNVNNVYVYIRFDNSIYTYDSYIICVTSFCHIA